MNEIEISETHNPDDEYFTNVLTMTAGGCRRAVITSGSADPLYRVYIEYVENGDWKGSRGLGRFETQAEAEGAAREALSDTSDQMEYGRVWLDGLGEDSVILAWYRPEFRWNGWLCPEMNRAAVEKIIGLITAEDQSGGSDVIELVTFDGPTMTVHGLYDDEPYAEQYDATLINGEYHWALGGCSWTWSKYEPWDEQMDG